METAVIRTHTGLQGLPNKQRGGDVEKTVRVVIVVTDTPILLPVYGGNPLPHPVASWRNQMLAGKWGHHTSRGCTSRGLSHQSRTVTPADDCHTSRGLPHQSGTATTVQDCHAS